MRHRIGLILAVIMIAVLFFPGSWGYLRLLRIPAAADQLSGLPAGGGSLMSDHSALFALVAIAVPALLAGILIVVPRISPLAAGLPGLLLLGWMGLYLASVRQAVDLIPLRSDPFGAGFEALLVNGILGAAGLAMTLPMLVPSRWRARNASGSEATAADEWISDPEATTEALRPQTTTERPTQLVPVAAGRLAPLPVPLAYGSTKLHQTTQPSRQR